MPDTDPAHTAPLADGLAELRRRRLAEDDRLVCLERAYLLAEARERFGALPQALRQAAVLRHLCAGITPVVEPGDVFAARLPEVVPDPAAEAFLAAHPELCTEPGLPGVLDGLSIFIPDWDWLLSAGLGGLADAFAARQDGVSAIQREFLRAAREALEAVSLLLQRYASAAREAGLPEVAERCARVSTQPPGSFADALQLLAVVHMVLAYLVGGRDVTPGRLDQYLLSLYRQDLATGALDRETAVALLAHFLFGLSQGAGNATDFDDNHRRSPCKYSHLYVTLGGCDAAGRPADNELSLVLLDAVRLLQYKEPTLCIRYRPDLAPAFRERVAALIADGLPVTVYNDEVVQRALQAQGVSPAAARGHAFSACHNVLVVGHEAGSGPHFCNVPQILRRVLDQATDHADFEEFFAALTREIGAEVEATAASFAALWETRYRESCPLLQSALYRFCLEQAEPAWQAAPLSHFNCHLLGLATTVDSLLALQGLADGAGGCTLGHLRAALAADWVGYESLRARLRSRSPRYGQDSPAALAMTRRVGEMWVAAVERAGRRGARLALWPGFYSHMSHLWRGQETPATPDGRRAGEALSESLSPSVGTVGCDPTAVLRTMSVLPFDHTPAGAAMLCLPVSAGGTEPAMVQALLEGYFAQRGLHLHLNVVAPSLLAEALACPERHAALMVRVAGYSAYFVRLSPEVQQDVVRRFLDHP